VKAEVNPGLCLGHGQCNANAPAVFDLDDDGYCVVTEPSVPVELQASARAGAEACPVQAITLS